ncbi:hypothetical protein BJ170DRAFT_593984 [Xylariales sp. AK1849]|nr:hypothetical protein BJ170DRAFT_593984 [Xylariales sp. AK1849]
MVQKTHLQPAASLMCPPATGASSSKSQVPRYLQKGTPSAEPSTECEKVLRHEWAKVFGVGENTIGRDDYWFDMGGDSLIWLVGAVRQLNLPLSVTLIFKHPRLDGTAEQVSASHSPTGAGNKAHLVDEEITTTVGLPSVPEVSKVLNTPQENIANILPVTDFQHYAIRCAYMEPKTEWNYCLMKFEKPKDISRLRNVS